MNITFNELVLRNFKSHKELLISFNPITRIYGTNGAGKSSIGEALTWALYGVDTLGNTLIKALSPEPTNYEYDRVEAHVLLTVDAKQIRISRMIENGNLLYFINDVPKKATAFKEVVESLFDKQLFLALFNPLYFFTQKWEEQRVQLLQYVPQPTNKEVLQKLTNLYLDKLTPLLKQKSLADLEAQHKDNKNRKDKDVPFLAGQVKAIRDDYNQAPEVEPDALKKLGAELIDVVTAMSEADAKEKAVTKANMESWKLDADMKRIKDKADMLKGRYSELKNTPIAEECDACKQPLNEETKATVKNGIDETMAKIKADYDELVWAYKELKKKIDAIVVPESPAELADLHDKRNDLENQINKLKDRAGLAAKLADAEKKEQEARDSHNESVLILEAIKAFKAVEAALMAEKIAELFPTLTLELKQYNADGTDKPFFEVYQNGKPFRKLSLAEKVIAGLELVDVLSHESGVITPVFVDNAESIRSYKQPLGQLIECRFVDQPLTIKEG